MASLAAIKELHRKVGLMPANTISDMMRKWYNATTKYIAREEKKLECPQNQPLPKREHEASGTE